LKVQGQSRLHSKIISQKTKRKGGCGGGREENRNGKKEGRKVRCQWLTPVILATQEAEIRGSWFKVSPVK
jgi:hypothetical protein